MCRFCKLKSSIFFLFIFMLQCIPSGVYDFEKRVRACIAQKGYTDVIKDIDKTIHGILIHDKSPMFPLSIVNDVSIKYSK